MDPSQSYIFSRKCCQTWILSPYLEDSYFQRACQNAGLKVKEIEGVLVRITEDYQIIAKRLIAIPRKVTRLKYFKKMIHEKGPTKEIYEINKALGYKRGLVDNVNIYRNNKQA